MVEVMLEGGYMTPCLPIDGDGDVLPFVLSVFLWMYSVKCKKDEQVSRLAAGGVIIASGI